MQKTLNLRTAAHGYSLLEMAISLLILSLLLLPVVHLYSMHKKSEDHALTLERINQAMQAIMVYHKANGHYPCPASLSTPFASATDGIETDCTDTDIPAGSCRDGICIEESATDEERSTRVRRGAIPYVLLDIQAEGAFDAYGSKLFYSVAEEQAATRTVPEKGGAITILLGLTEDYNAEDTETFERSDFLIFSAGTGRQGAFSDSGLENIPCASTGPDSTNCAVKASAIYRAASFSLARPDFYFDDFISYLPPPRNDGNFGQRAGMMCPDNEFLQGLNDQQMPVCGPIATAP